MNEIKNFNLFITFIINEIIYFININNLYSMKYQDNKLLIIIMIIYKI